MELIPKRLTVLVGTCMSFVDGSSPLYTSVLFYFVPNMKLFFLFCLVKTLIVVGFVACIGIESPTWLYNRNRLEECQNGLNFVQAFNNHPERFTIEKSNEDMHKDANDPILT